MSFTQFLGATWPFWLVIVFLIGLAVLGGIAGEIADKELRKQKDVFWARMGQNNISEQLKKEG